MSAQVKLLPSDAALRVAIRAAMGSVADVYLDELVASIAAIAPSITKPDMVPRGELDIVQLKLDCLIKVVEAYEYMGKPGQNRA